MPSWAISSCSMAISLAVGVEFRALPRDRPRVDESPRLLASTGPIEQHDAAVLTRKLTVHDRLVPQKQFGLVRHAPSKRDIRIFRHARKFSRSPVVAAFHVLDDVCRRVESAALPKSCTCYAIKLNKELKVAIWIYSCSGDHFLVLLRRDFCDFGPRRARCRCGQ